MRKVGGFLKDTRTRRKRVKSKPGTEGNSNDCGHPSVGRTFLQDFIMGRWQVVTYTMNAKRLEILAKLSFLIRALTKIFPYGLPV